mmetsp:Transcript_9258/g.29646  ORF Transcript_9258/g.29646 Transcript_9258/m.29646 type:complete len:431 (+) Transcript_9258:220-1512(+)
MYLVYAFGFDLLDNTATDSETLTLYGVDSARLGSVSLRSVRESQARHAGRAGAGRRSRETFLGILSRGAPIGFASFDEAQDADATGIASIAFGYRTSDTAYNWPAWATLAAALALALVAERAALLGYRRRVSLPTAAAWAAAWLGFALAVGGVLWRARSWRPALLYSVCASLNVLLSGDNLLVFLLLLRQLGLHEDWHLTAVCAGVLASLGVRLLVLLFCAALLERFWWVIILFALFLLVSALRMLLFPDEPEPPPLALAGSSDGTDGAGGAEAHWALRALGTCMPLRWEPEHDGRCLVYGGGGEPRDRRCGGVGATRLLVAVCGIVVCDLLFAMDSTPVMLSVTRAPLLLVASQATSMLFLRPLYFMLAAITEYLDAMQQTLAVVLIIIACKMLAEAAGYEVSLPLFFGTLLVWRAGAAAAVLLRKVGA